MYESSVEGMPGMIFLAVHIWFGPVGDEVAGVSQGLSLGCSTGACRFQASSSIPCETQIHPLALVASGFTVASGTLFCLVADGRLRPGTEKGSHVVFRAPVLRNGSPSLHLLLFSPRT